MAIAVAAVAQAPAPPAPAPGSPGCASTRTGSRAGGSSRSYVERRPHGHQRLNRRLLQLSTRTAPHSNHAGQVNDLYNFNDKTDQFNLARQADDEPRSGSRGRARGLLFGRANTLINGVSTATTQGKYLEQAFLSLKPAKAKGFEVGLWQVRHIGRRRSDRVKGQLELLTLAAVCECHSVLPLWRAHLDAGFKDGHDRRAGGERLEQRDHATTAA